jgi:HPt (histidine-containing phosphotransfer) domain-containing protein
MDDYLSKPVRPDDIRKMIEKWGPKASAGPPPNVPAAVEDTKVPCGKASDEKTAVLDWERLMEMADNDRDMLKELVSLYLQETEQQMEQLGAAVASSSAPEVKRLAHKCAGGSATIGVGRLVPLLRKLEQQGEEGHLETSGLLYKKARKEFGILRDHLELHPNGVFETNVR